MASSCKLGRYCGQWRSYGSRGHCQPDPCGQAPPDTLTGLWSGAALEASGAKLRTMAQLTEVHAATHPGARLASDKATLAAALAAELDASAED